MASYLTADAFKARPPEFIRPQDVDELEVSNAGVTLKVLTRWSSWIDSRLSKRYATPIQNPPESLLGWLTDLATETLRNIRGYDASDPFMQKMEARVLAAKAEIQEAASSKDALFGLPATDGKDASAVAFAGPLSYTEASPFVSADMMERQGHHEDDQGFGTFGGGP
jgi:phage gp36-like protein